MLLSIQAVSSEFNFRPAHALKTNNNCSIAICEDSGSPLAASNSDSGIRRSSNDELEDGETRKFHSHGPGRQSISFTFPFVSGLGGESIFQCDA